ncbi:MAG: hypothetical protein ACYSX0_09920 [Planctomycetota bacterium]|jgi:hypothetical protein
MQCSRAAPFYFAFRFLLRRAYRHEAIARPLRQAVPHIAVGVVICLALLYGEFSYYPLRRSDAFQSPDRFSSDLALNPVLFFLDTLYTDEGAKFDENATRACYPRMVKYLGVEEPGPAALTHAQTVRPTPLGNKGPNVVVMLLESIAAHHSGAFGNPLDPSPRSARAPGEEARSPCQSEKQESSAPRLLLPVGCGDHRRPLTREQPSTKRPH